MNGLVSEIRKLRAENEGLKQQNGELKARINRMVKKHNATLDSRNKRVNNVIDDLMRTMGMT